MKLEQLFKFLNGVLTDLIPYLFQEAMDENEQDEGRPVVDHNSSFATIAAGECESDHVGFSYCTCIILDFLYLTPYHRTEIFNRGICQNHIQH